MDPVAQLRATRKALGLDHEEFGALVGLTGDSAGRNIRAIEAGSKPLVGPMIPLVQSLDSGLDLPTLRSRVFRAGLPKFVDLSTVDEAEIDGVRHTEYPRFTGVFEETLPQELRSELADSDVPFVEIPGETGLMRVYVVLEDPFIGDLSPLLDELEAYLAKG